MVDREQQKLFSYTEHGTLKHSKMPSILISQKYFHIFSQNSAALHLTGSITWQPHQGTKWKKCFKISYCHFSKGLICMIQMTIFLLTLFLTAVIWVAMVTAWCVNARFETVFCCQQCITVKNGHHQKNCRECSLFLQANALTETVIIYFFLLKSWCLQNLLHMERHLAKNFSNFHSWLCDLI